PRPLRTQDRSSPPRLMSPRPARWEGGVLAPGTLRVSPSPTRVLPLLALAHSREQLPEAEVAVGDERASPLGSARASGDPSVEVGTARRSVTAASWSLGRDEGGEESHRTTARSDTRAAVIVRGL